MTKKIILGALFVGVIGLLLWGGVNWTLAKTNDSAGSERAEDKRGGWDQDHATGSGLTTDARQGKGSDTDRSQGNGNWGNSGSGSGSARSVGGAPLDVDSLEALHLALDDEYHALAVYQSVIVSFGEVEPFVEIAQSEQRHIDALINQYNKHGIPVPENTWIGNIPLSKVSRTPVSLVLKLKLPMLNCMRDSFL
jgi:hypothetical protein